MSKIIAAANEQKTLSLKDLNLSAASEEGHEYEVTSPVTGKGLGVFITVRGDHSEKVRAFERKRYNTQAHEKYMADRRGLKTDDFTPIEDIEALVVESAVVRTIGWRGLDEPFNEENARVLYATNVDIREMTRKKAAESANFMKI